MYKQLMILANAIIIAVGAPFYSASLLLRGMACIVGFPANALARIGNALIEEYERGCRENTVGKDI